MKQRAFMALVLGLMMVMAVKAQAQPGNSVEVAVVSDNGEVQYGIPHKAFESGGTYVVKKYLVAGKGRNYGIVVRNNSSERIGIVVAVDGRNVIDGKMSDLGWNERMYIIGPYGSVRIDGWRPDNSTVHQFYFTDPGDSYSVRTFSDSSAMGVIAVAAFREKERDSWLEKRSSRMAPGAAASNKMMARDEAAGTGFGKGRYSPVVTVAFDPGRVAFNKTLIKYEWRETLCRKGILICEGPQESNRLWDEGSYAPFPPGY